MKTRRNGLLPLLLVLTILSLVAGGALICRQYRQDGLNRSLLASVKRSDGAAVVRLLDQGADANVRDATAPAVTLWERLLRAVRREPQRQDETGPTALMLAVESGNADIVRALLSHRARGVNDRIAIPNEEAIPEDRPLLLIAAEQGNLPVAEALLDYGADIDGRNSHGKTALIDAIWEMKMNYDAMLLTNHKHEPKRRLALVKRLVERGANINACDDGGCTALFHASGRNWLDLVKFLLTKGANPNLSAKGDSLPILAAIDNGHTESVKMLLEHGANPNWGTWDARALTDAAWKGEKDIVCLLLDHGADPTYRVENAGTANGNDYSARFAAHHERPFDPQDYQPIIQLLDAAVSRWNKRRR